MDLAQLSSHYGDFYAPGFEIHLSRQGQAPRLDLGVSQVEVSLAIGKAAHFQFTIVNAFDASAGQFLASDGQPLLPRLAFGTPVRIRMGYGSFTNYRSLMLGLITEVSTTFAEGGTPEIAVSGQDDLFAMMADQVSHTWQDMTDGQVVAGIARNYGLDTDIDPTPKHPQIEQSQQSDFAFVQKLAQRNGFEFYVDATPLDDGGRPNLRFGKARYQSDDGIQLKWGAGLLRFSPQVNLAQQISAVEVYGWDSRKKEAIVGRAQAGDEPGRKPDAESGSDRLYKAIGKTPVLQIRQPVFDEAEATTRARSILHARARRFVTGEAECIGLPDLRPDRRVFLTGLGAPFTSHYYISEVTHRIDAAGYHARMKIEETTL